MKPDDRNRGSELAAEANHAPFWLSTLGLAAVWILVGTLFALQFIVLEKLPAAFAFRMALTDWGPWILASPLVLWLSRRIPIRADSWKRAIPAHLLASIALAMAFELAFFASRGAPPIDRGPPPAPGGFIGQAEQGPRPPPMENRSAMRMIHARFHIPVYWLLVAAAHAIAFHRRSLQRERRALLAEARLTEARLAALQSQINPHFLFNTLNAIAQYVHEDPELAERMIESLSSLLRLVLAASEKREVSIREELIFIDHYLSIQKLRFADRLTVEKSIDPRALDAQIATLLLQPLVENAIIHGTAKARKPGTVFIRAKQTDGRLQLEIADTGAEGPPLGVPGEKVTVIERVGVGNTRARLMAAYGAEAFLALSAAPEGGLSVKIEIPVKTGPSSA